MRVLSLSVLLLLHLQLLQQPCRSAFVSSSKTFKSVSKLVPKAEAKKKNSNMAKSSTTSDDLDLLSSFRQSGRLEEASTRVKSLSLALFGFVMAALSLVTFNALTNQMYAPNDVASSLIFDLRNGYTPTEVAAALKIWGIEGRFKYLLIELIDVTFYCTGYRALFLVIANRVCDAFSDAFLSSSSSKALTSRLKYFGLFPIILSLIDFFEDSLQCAVTISYNIAGGDKAAVDTLASWWWPLLVQCASIANQFKWLFVRLGSSTLGLLVLAVAASFIYSSVIAAASIVSGKSTASNEAKKKK